MSQTPRPQQRAVASVNINIHPTLHALFHNPSKHATMSRNNQKHIDAGIKQLVGHIIPKAKKDEDAAFIQETVDEHIQLAHAVLNE